jgi:GNAT superfamily N-acetyltransferase
MHIRALIEEEWPDVFPIVRELREHLTIDTYLSRCLAAAEADAYTLYGAFEDDRCVAVMGIRELTDLLHGRHLYIDDLVVTSAVRARGIGAELLRFAEALAASSGAAGVRLSTGADHHAGRRFYEREGWTLRAVTFKKGFPG